MEDRPYGILVGVTARFENTDALRFAARAAAATGAVVTLVHVRHLALPSAAPRPDVWDRGPARVLGEVREELEALADHGVQVRTETRHGDPGAALAKLTARAGALVLQHRDLSRVHRAVSGSTVTVASAHALCPVVAVPAGHPLHSHRLVVAGVHADGGPAEVVEAAFAEARRSGSALQVAHASRRIPAYDSVRSVTPVRREEAEAHLRTALAPVARRYPEVRVEHVVSTDWREDVLMELSAHADLLVLGRHGRRGPAGFRLGAMAHTAVQAASCPVMVVPV